MAEKTDVLISVLEQLETAAAAPQVSIETVVEQLGARSFAALMLIFALIAVSPASIVPGVTTMVAVLEFLLVSQMILGRRYLWLPEYVSKREFSGENLRKAIGWLRRPVAMVDHVLRPRLRFLTEKPCLYLWLLLIWALTLFMPFMELIPGSGTVASGFIALVAAAILTKDGALLGLAALCGLGLIWMAGVVGAAIASG